MCYNFTIKILNIVDFYTFLKFIKKSLLKMELRQVGRFHQLLSSISKIIHKKYLAI